MSKGNYNRIVAFLDILGFSRLVENSSPMQVVRAFHEIFSSILISRYREIQNEIVELALVPDSKEQAKPLFEKLKYASSILSKDGTVESKDELDTFLKGIFPFHYMIVSDSIIVYSDVVVENTNIVDVFEEFVVFVRHLVVSSLLRRLPLRGAISFGEFYVDDRNSIYFGKSLLDAIKLEKQQNWIGCIISENLNDIIADYLSTRSFPIPKQIVPTLRHIHPLAGHTINRYPVPLHKKPPMEAFIVNWYGALIGKIQLNDGFFDSELTGIPSIDVKYRNTLQYMKWWHSALESILLQTSETGLKIT